MYLIVEYILSVRIHFIPKFDKGLQSVYIF